MNEYLEAILFNIKREVKEFFGRFIWIMKEDWGWHDWTIAGFFGLILFVIGFWVG